MRITACMSALVANRKEFHALAESLEQLHKRVIDVKELEAEIDSLYDGREALSPKEAKALLKRLSNFANKGNRRRP